MLLTYSLIIQLLIHLTDFFFDWSSWRLILFDYWLLKANKIIKWLKKNRSTISFPVTQKSLPKKLYINLSTHLTSSQLPPPSVTIPLLAQEYHKFLVQVSNLGGEFNPGLQAHSAIGLAQSLGQVKGARHTPPKDFQRKRTGLMGSHELPPGTFFITKCAISPMIVLSRRLEFLNDHKNRFSG